MDVTYVTDSLGQDFVEKYLIPLVTAVDLAVELSGGKEKGWQWMSTPNSYYFGRSPFRMCFLGEGERVISGLLERLDRKTPYESKN